MKITIKGHDALKSFVIREVPSLDPVTVILEDIGPGEGRVFVECYGEAWAAYWGGMGQRTIAQFVSECGIDYLHSNLIRGKVEKKRVQYIHRIVQAVIDGCKLYVSPITA